MTVAVDTNILFDILLPDPEFKDTSFSLIVSYARRDKLIISEIVYGELASQFTEREVLNSFLHEAGIFPENTSPRGLWIAARAWDEYISRRDNTLQCSRCGNQQRLKCEQCGAVITARQHIISDFIIGGHALAGADKLLTRDRGFYRTYFPDLEIEYPEQ